MKVLSDAKVNMETTISVGGEDIRFDILSIGNILQQFVLVSIRLSLSLPFHSV